MALDSSGDSAKSGTKLESLKEEDLEDGEIASDDDGVPEPVKVEAAKEEKPAPKVEPALASPPKMMRICKPQADDDFEKELQKLKKDFERKKESSRRESKKSHESFDRDGKRKKRRSSDDFKVRKEKRRKLDSGKGSEKGEDDDIDEDEMLGLCIRGGSPTINLEKTEVWSGKQPILDPNWQFSDHSEHESDYEDRDDRRRRRRDKDRRNFKTNSREDRDIKRRIQMKRKNKGRKDSDGVDMICINFMKGNCTKGNECFYSHTVCPPKKMELCKFYLMDCCAKRDKCLYLHEEFPCKFYHTGLKCYSGKNCKFSHDPLNSLSKDILLKHLETAPKEILGDFPRLSRDCAETMVNNTGKPAKGPKIPSLFDIQVSIPPEFRHSASERAEERTTPPCSPPPNVRNSPKSKPKEGPKYYQESEVGDNDRQQENENLIDFAKELEAYKMQIQNKNADEKSYEPTPSGSKEYKSDNEGKFYRKHRKYRDDEDSESDSRDDGRRKKKYDDKYGRRDKCSDSEDKDDWNPRKEKYPKGGKFWGEKKWNDLDKSENLPVRVADDGSFGGIKFKILNKKEINKSCTSTESDALLPVKIEKPNEFLSSDDERPLNYLIKTENKVEYDDKIKEEEMEEFGVEIKQDIEDETDEPEIENALVIETNDDPEEEEKSSMTVPKHLPRKQRELFMRIQAQQSQRVKEDLERKNKEEERKESIFQPVETGSCSEEEVGKTPSPEPADENWYSSDEDEPVVKKESPLNNALNNLNPEQNLLETPTLRSGTPPPLMATTTPPLRATTTPPLTGATQPPLTTGNPPQMPKTDMGINDFSKINITELLTSIRQVTNKSCQGTDSPLLQPAIVPPASSYELPQMSNSVKVNCSGQDTEKKEVKDPRLRDPRVGAESKSAASRRNSSESNKPPGKSIYDSANFKFETKDSDLRFQSTFDSDERVKTLDSIAPFGDIDLRTLGGRQGDKAEGDFDMRKFGLPFKPIPLHSAATEIDASINSHPPINYKVETIVIPRPDFSSIKISPNDPQVKKDPRLRRLFRINSSESEEKKDEQKKTTVGPTDPRQRKPVIADTPKSPTESPFSPKQNEQNIMGGGNQNLLSANLIMLAQLGLSAAAGLDPRVQLLNKTPQEIEMLRNQLSSLENQPEFELFRKQIMSNENMDRNRPPNPGLLPTPMQTPGMGLLGPAPGFMMPGMGMPDPSVMMGPMGPMGPNPMGFDPRFNPNANTNDEEMADSDNSNRHFNRGFRGDRRGRGNWRGNRDRNWDRDNRRHPKRDDRDRSRHARGRDDRRERKRSNTPE